MEIYLTNELKEYYMKDFHEYVLASKHGFWALDPGIRNYLISINNSPVIQTLYSKKADPLKFGSYESYIELAYFQHVELKIFREIIPTLLNEYNKMAESTLTCVFQQPQENPNYGGEKQFGLGCIDNKDYFFINSVQIDFESSNYDCHEKIWQDISFVFAALK